MHDPRSSLGGPSRVVAGPRSRRHQGRHRRMHMLMLSLSAGSVVLGIGCVGWALMNIRAQSVPSIAYRIPSPSSPTTVTVSKGGSPTTAAVPKKPSHPSAPRSAVKVIYSKNPSEGDTLGSLSIPALGQTLPIIEGTGADDLKKGVGHFAQSVLPGQKDNCVLSGHRDTVFSELGKLKTGDRFIVQTATGTYDYQIKRIRIVHANDRTVIVPTDHAVLTVTTCYPFHFIGSAPDRYVLSADMVARK